MTYHAKRQRTLARACWRDGRGALRCRRPGMAFSGLGADASALEQLQSTGVTLPSGVTPEQFLIAQLNRFIGDSVPEGQRVGNTKNSFAAGITINVADDVMTLVIRAIQSSLTQLQDESARTLLAEARGIMSAADPTTGDIEVAYVKDHLAQIGVQIAGYADSLGLPPAEFPVTVAGFSLGISSTTLALAGGAAVIGYLLLNSRKRGR